VKLIAGLGNPGPRYRGTRHNVGFEVADELARRGGAAFESAPADALVARIRGLEPVLLVKPLTFMNLSGGPIGELVRYYRVALADLLVVLDEVQLPLGHVRARPRGSDGGHHGLRSILAGFATPEIARLRIGVGRGDPRRDLADHVLARFDADEREEVDGAIGRAADAVELFVTDGIAAVMNRYNRKAETETTTEEDGE
jgi:peptidyl-tRNA hydrolase, PTH1 family